MVVVTGLGQGQGRPVVEASAPRFAAMAPMTGTSLFATARLQPSDWGTTVSLEAGYTDEPGSSAFGSRATDELCVTGADGRVQTLATWAGTIGRAARPTGTTSLALRDIRAVEVRMMPAGTLLLAGHPEV